MSQLSAVSPIVRPLSEQPKTHSEVWREKVLSSNMPAQLHHLLPKTLSSPWVYYGLPGTMPRECWVLLFRPSGLTLGFKFNQVGLQNISTLEAVAVWLPQFSRLAALRERIVTLDKQEALRILEDKKKFLPNIPKCFRFLDIGASYDLPPKTKMFEYDTVRISVC